MMNPPVDTTMPTGLESPYQGYTYAYPHKSAYRRIEPARLLRDVWQSEPQERRFLYLHIPFCEMRCGFCNLFTLANPDKDLEGAFLAALAREMSAVCDAVDGANAPPAQIALGGGTPTFLAPEALAKVFDLIARYFQGAPIQVPCSVETSPRTATPERLHILAEHGVSRISIGVQSFIDAEARVIGRPQRRKQVEAALDAIRQHPFPVLNIDLIYGAAEQTAQSWRESIQSAIDWRAEEIYLYPLYVRPKTGLDGRASVWDEHRLMLYRAGRAHLLEAGYQQISMRHFRRHNAPHGASDEYSCQEDAMIGIGPGARSYTRTFHYSTDFAVSRAAILRVLNDYVSKSTESFTRASHGIDISRHEQMRRFLLKSILRCDGLDCTRFTDLYGADPEHVFPELHRLNACGLLRRRGQRLIPTDAGLERSDAIGPWLYTHDIGARMAAFEAI